MLGFLITAKQSKQQLKRRLSLGSFARFDPQRQEKFFCWKKEEIKHCNRKKPQEGAATKPSVQTVQSLRRWKGHQSSSEFESLCPRYTKWRNKDYWETLIWQIGLKPCLWLAWFLMLSKGCMLETCGQSYNHFTIVNYDSRVVIWANL